MVAGDARAREEARLQQPLPVVEEGFDFEGAGLGVDRGVDPREPAHEGTARVGLHLDLHREAHRDPARHLLRRLQPYPQGIVVHDGHDRGLHLHVLTRADHALPHLSREGGADHGVPELLVRERHRGRALRSLGPQVLHVLHRHVVGRPGRVVPGLGLVEGPPRDEALREELLRPLVLLLGVRPVGFRLPHLRRVPGVFQLPAAAGRGEAGPDLLEGGLLLLEGQAQLDGHDLHERPARLDPVPHVDVDLLDPALHLGAHGHLLEGEERAHRLHLAVDRARDHGHDARPDGLRGALGVVVRPAPQAARPQGGQDPHQERDRVPAGPPLGHSPVFSYEPVVKRCKDATAGSETRCDGPDPVGYS